MINWPLCRDYKCTCVLSARLQIKLTSCLDSWGGGIFNSSSPIYTVLHRASLLQHKPFMLLLLNHKDLIWNFPSYRFPSTYSFYHQQIFWEGSRPELPLRHPWPPSLLRPSLNPLDYGGTSVRLNHTQLYPTIPPPRHHWPAPCSWKSTTTLPWNNRVPLSVCRHVTWLFWHSQIRLNMYEDSQHYPCLH